MKKITFVNGKDTAVLTEKDGKVQVERDGQVTPFSANHTFETVEETFLTNGWQQDIEDIFKTSSNAPLSSHAELARANNGVTKEMQEKIDAYVSLHEYMSALKSELERLKKHIRTYMEKHNITELESALNKKISLVDAVQSNSVATFSNFDLSDIRSLLTGDILDEVTELRVNSDKLEALIKLGQIDDEVAKKIEKKRISLKGTPRFVLKKK